MQIRNKSFLLAFFILFLSTSFLYGEELNISAKEILIDKEKNIVTGIGSVKIIDKEGNVIKSDKAIYKKSEQFVSAEGNVNIRTSDGTVLKTSKATYSQVDNLIVAYDNSELSIKEGYELVSNNIFYQTEEKIISSNENSVFTDSDNNIVKVTMFQFNMEKNLFSSIGEINIVDANNNKYFFKELHVDTKKKEMIGSDVSVLLDQESAGVSNESDPRFVANDIFISEKKSSLSKGVFTTCKKRGNKCPPWQLKAKKISHDKTKKTIYYEHAILKVYDIPIFYFPKFFHPDPTVKRQSGFLTPFFTNSTQLGTGFGLPYYWSISHDKDLTFSPKFYSNEHALFLNEYRQAFSNGFLTLDTSYTEGYKGNSSKRTKGSRNHIFAKLDFDLSQNDSYESDFSLTMQKTSNDTYFRVHDIKTALVDHDNTDLKNEISYKYSKDNNYLNITATVYENLREKTNSRYEYVLPNILYGKSFFTEKFGSLDITSNAVYRNYATNKHTSFLTNDIIWSPSSYINKKGFVNTVEGMIKNKNYEATNTTDLKTKGTINELSSVLSFKSSLPMKKDRPGFSNIFSPNFMIRYAPGHMKSIKGDDVTLKYANLYSTNKTSEIEDGLSAILGFDFKKNTKDDNGAEKEKFALSIGQVFNPKENKDMPSKSSLDQKTSDIVGEMNYNFSKIGRIDYKFALDHNLNDLNYNEISTTLNFGKVDFNLDYLEENNHVGSEHYVNSGISVNFNDQNKLSFTTKKNFKTSSTEFYDINYQYKIDCLTAGLLYRREFYEDSDVEQKDSLMFVITFVPFSGVRTPFISP